MRSVIESTKSHNELGNDEESDTRDNNTQRRKMKFEWNWCNK